MGMVANRYLFAWNNIAARAAEHHLDPQRLAEVTDDGTQLFDTLADACAWAPATVALYAKVCRYAGIAVTVKTTPEPATSTDTWPDLTRLVDYPRGMVHTLHVRAVVLCTLLCGTDLALPHLCALTDNDVDSLPNRALLTWWATDIRPMQATLGGPYLLPTLRRGPGGKPPGGPLSARTAQLVFAEHLHATVARLGDDHRDTSGYDGLTLRGYRRAARSAAQRNVRARR